ncbi:MAG: response regulator [Candidatus Omnitrophota bacterium]|nr:response regulator [Candidatus Omnitrophota bacterium]MDZ4242031.1 response regulator [Candidatus Omnitrophota bacterium]
MRTERILTIDDDSDILDVLALTLSEHYDVFQASNGKEGLKMVHSCNPNLIICDYMMPVMNGKDFCRTMKKDILLQHIPIIMLTGKGEVKDMVGGIEAGADDYLVKPFEPDALLARIRMILRRTIRSLDANPLTHLPGNTSIMEEIQNHITSQRPFAVGYADLDKFKIYNDKYGFEKGDEIIREVARILIAAVREKAGENAFVGHIGGDDFVFITDDAVMDPACQQIIDELDKIAPQFYSEKDRKNGFIIGKDRQGNEIKTGLISISIGIVSNVNQPITHVAQIAEIGAELKKYAKSFQQSIYVRDKRKRQDSNNEDQG